MAGFILGKYSPERNSRRVFMPFAGGQRLVGVVEKLDQSWYAVEPSCQRTSDMETLIKAAKIAEMREKDLVAAWARTQSGVSGKKP